MNPDSLDLAARLAAVAESLRGLAPDLQHAGRASTAAALAAMAGLFDDLADNLAAGEAEPALLFTYVNRSA